MRRQIALLLERIFGWTTGRRAYIGELLLSGRIVRRMQKMKDRSGVVVAEELLVITKAKELSKRVFMATANVPQEYALTLAARMQNRSIDVIENLYRANAVYIPQGEGCKTALNKRKAFQNKAVCDLQILDYLSNISSEVLCIQPEHKDDIVRSIYECRGYLISWIKSDSTRLGTYS